jgi:hypothetical protein
MSSAPATADEAALESSRNQPDVTVEMWRGTDDRGPHWTVRATCHGIGYNNSDYEAEPQQLLNWMQSTVTFLMGRVAADQEGEKPK